RVEAGGPHRGVDPEEESDQGGDGEGQQDGVRRDDGLDGLSGGPAEAEAVEQVGAPGAAQEADGPAGDADHGGLDQELGEDVPPGGADGLADPDLAGALGHRDQHDVHDPDPADDEGDPGHRPEEDGDEPGDLVRRLQQGVLAEDGE